MSSSLFYYGFGLKDPNYMKAEYKCVKKEVIKKGVVK